MKSVRSNHERMISVLSLKNKTSLATAPNINDLTDEELVSLYVAGRGEDAFNELVSRYSEKVYRLAYRITNNQNDAEEILQEVFLILVEKLSTFRKESRFSTWLYRVASNASFMYIRNMRKSRDKETSLDDYKPYNDYGVLEGVEEKDWSGRPDSQLLGREGDRADREGDKRAAGGLQGCISFERYRKAHEQGNFGYIEALGSCCEIKGFKGKAYSKG